MFRGIFQKMHCLKRRPPSLLASFFDQEQNTFVVIYLVVAHLNLALDLVTS